MAAALKQTDAFELELGESKMAGNSLQNNMEITKISLVKNLGVCWGQAKEIAMNAAMQAVLSRKTDPEKSEQHAANAEYAHKCVVWIERVDKLTKECPIFETEDNDKAPKKDEAEKPHPAVEIETPNHQEDPK